MNNKLRYFFDLHQILFNREDCYILLVLIWRRVKRMTKPTKDDELYREMCRVVGKVVLEMRDLGQEPKYIVIAGVLRTALANQRIQRSALEKTGYGNRD
ncbi:protein ydhZ [Salmonella enterica subsp. enterica]|uniref:Fumarase D n=3 Tax=Salmonella enterica TaxID=28901 RepID=A0A3S4I0R4_SALET|nr:protein ydhZ [Salmonella enterica subsp. enterica]